MCDFVHHFIYTCGKSMSVSLPVFINLTYTQEHYVHISYTRLCPNQTINMKIFIEIPLYPGLQPSGREVESVTPFSARIVRNECTCTCLWHAQALAVARLCVSDSARKSLTEAIRITGDTYCEIGKLFEYQPKLDWEPLGDVLHLYKGIISSYPDILTVHKVSEMYPYLMFLQQLM